MCDTKVLLSLWVNHHGLKADYCHFVALPRRVRKLRRDGWLHVMCYRFYDFLPFPEIPFCSCTCLIVKRYSEMDRTGKKAGRRGKARKLENCIYIARKEGSPNRESCWLLPDGFPLL